MFTWLVCYESERVSVAGGFHPCICNCRILQVVICTLTCWDHQWCWRCISHHILAENPTIHNMEDGRKYSTLHFMYLVLEKKIFSLLYLQKLRGFFCFGFGFFFCFPPVLTGSHLVASWWALSPQLFPASWKNWFSWVSGSPLGNSRTSVANGGLVKSKHFYQMMYWGPKGCLEDYHCRKANQKKVLGEKWLSNTAPKGDTWIRNILSYAV